MIGGLPPLPKPNWKPRTIPRIIDVPSAKPGIYGHVAREPNSDYKYKLLQYRQRKVEMENKYQEKLIHDLNTNKTMEKYMKHAQQKSFQRTIKQKVKKKIIEYDQNIEDRREKLRDVYWKESNMYVIEIVESSQKGIEWQNEQYKKRLKELKAEREKERLEVVRYKIKQQNTTNCEQRRTLLIKLRQKEAQEGQLLQIQENLNRKESGQELDQFWHAMKLKEFYTMTERAEHEEMNKRKTNIELKEKLDQQMSEMNHRRQMLLEGKKEDRRTCERLQEQMNKEDMTVQKMKQQNRKEFKSGLLKQMEEKEMLAREHRKEEIEVEKMYEQITENEIKKERERIKNLTDRLKKETNQYLQYAAHLDNQKKAEEKNIDELIDKAKEDIQRKQNEARCKIHEAKMALQDEVTRERKKQIEHKRKEAEEQLKLKQIENQLSMAISEQNDKLKIECRRKALLTTQIYREDLAKQDKYRRLLIEHEKKEVDRQLLESKIEEDKYIKLIRDILKGISKETGFKHPFKKVLDSEACPCPLATCTGLIK